MLHTSGLIALTILLSSFVSFASAEPAPAVRESSPYPEDDFFKDGNNFEQFAKFIVLLDEQGKPKSLVFQNQELFSRHADFLATRPEFSGMTMQQIDDLSYKFTSSRKVILGVVTTRAFDDAISFNRFNLVMANVPKSEEIIAIHKLLLDVLVPPHHTLAGDSPLEFQALPHQEVGLADLGPALRAAQVPVAASEVLPNRIPYTNAWALGKLLWIDSQEDLEGKVAAGLVGESTILASKESLRDFPLVAGVIVGHRLTAASHEVLLAQMYGIPVVYVNGVEELFKPHDGESMFLQAIAPPGSGFNQRTVDFAFGLSEAEFSRAAEFKATPELNVTVDQAEDRIVSVRTLDRMNIPAYGGKASQMGLLLTTIPDLTVKEAAALPVSYYLNFIKPEGIPATDTLFAFITKRLAEIPHGKESSKLAADILTSIRAKIQAAPLSSEASVKICNELVKLFPQGRIKLKIHSSSNVEDGEEFNGAGLYESKSFWLDGCVDRSDLDKTLKQVFASLYTQRGFVARRRFSVDESKVAMGGAIFPVYKNEIHNGVATILIDENGRAGFENVTQVGEELVTRAEGEGQAEQVSAFGDRLTVDIPYLGNSKTRKLMRDQDYLTLRDAMVKLAARYAPEGKGVHIESEWKQIPDGKGGTALVIKQVRPVPRAPKVRGRDGSEYYFIVPQEVKVGEIGQPSNAFEALFAPSGLRVHMSGFSQADVEAGRVSVDSLEYDMQGQHLVVKNPKVEIERIEGGYINLRIGLEHPVVKSLQLVASLTNENKNSVLNPFGSGGYLYFEAKESGLPWLEDVFGDFRMGMSNYERESHAQDPWYDDTVPGLGRYSITVTGKKTIAIALTQVKERGDGDGRETKVGHASIVGLLKRPIEIGAKSIGYGANHHSSIENYTFDLLGDPSLTTKEKRAIVDAGGQYLILKNEGEGDSLVYFATPGKRAKKIGEWSIEQGESAASLSPVLSCSDSLKAKAQ